MYSIIACALFLSLYPMLFYMSKWEKEKYYKEHKSHYFNGEYKFKKPQL